MQPSTYPARVALVRESYTNPAATLARVTNEPTQYARIRCARHMLAVAQDPQSRFGLEQSDIPQAVIDALRAYLAEQAPAWATSAALRRFRALASQRFSLSEIRTKLESRLDALGLEFSELVTIHATTPAPRTRMARRLARKAR